MNDTYVHKLDYMAGVNSTFISDANNLTLEVDVLVLSNNQNVWNVSSVQVMCVVEFGGWNQAETNTSYVSVTYVNIPVVVNLTTNSTCFSGGQTSVLRKHSIL